MRATTLRHLLRLGIAKRPPATFVTVQYVNEAQPLSQRKSILHYGVYQGRLLEAGPSSSGTNHLPNVIQAPFNERCRCENATA